MPLGITQGISGWNAQQNNVERLMDNSAYTAAHPDDTLVLAGPPRLADLAASDGAGNTEFGLLAVGLLQTFQITAQRPTTQLMAIGSGRSFFVSGKAQHTWRVGRLFCNGRNLLRVLHHNIVASQVQVGSFDDSPVPTLGDNSTMFFINLDSEMYYVPFGMAVLFKDKMHDFIGSFYIELAMIVNYTLGFTAGQNMIMEDVGGLCDRLASFYPSTAINSGGVARDTVDRVIGFASGGSEGNIYQTGGKGLFDNV